MICTEYVDNEKFALWYDLLKKYNGRFNYHIQYECRTYVCYTFDDVEQANKFNRTFEYLTTPIVEYKSSMWVVIYRKIKGWYRAHFTNIKPE